MKFFLIGLLVFGMIVTGISWYLVPDSLSSCPAPAPGTCESADAIVVVSGGDTNARVDHGVALFKKGWAKKLIFSGAAADQTSLSNAQAMKLRAIYHGISEAHIAIEEYSRTTSENAINTSQYFQRNNIDRVILVTSGYHQRRAFLEFQRSTDQQVTVLNSPLEQDRQWSWFWWLTPGGWWLAGSELTKIMFFYATEGD